MTMAPSPMLSAARVWLTLILMVLLKVGAGASALIVELPVPSLLARSVLPAIVVRVEWH